jgi:hypothetical protein
MHRTVIVGDLHGCLDELQRLLDHVGFSAGDRLVSVGDTVVRGPQPAETLDLLMALGARAVRGNHEDRLLRWRESAQGKVPMTIGAMTRETAKRLRNRHWRWLGELPLWLDLPEHGVRVVHAGLVPGVPIDRQSPRTLLYVRCLGKQGQPIESRDLLLWGERYHGPPHVVFGHNAMEEPQIHKWATGLDTGAVYGNRLTAMVLRAGERPPPARERTLSLVSVPARRRYVDH